MNTTLTPFSLTDAEIKLADKTATDMGNPSESFGKAEQLQPDERTLLAAFRNIFDPVDRELIIGFAQRRAAAQVARKPALRLVVCGGAT